MTENEQTRDPGRPWPETTLPSTPAGQQLRAYLAAFNTGSPEALHHFITTHYETLRTDSAPPDVYAWWHVVAQRATGGLRPTYIEEATPTTLRVRAEPLAPLCPLPAGCAITVTVSEEAPYPLTTLSTEPRLPPASWADIGDRRLAYTRMGTGAPTVVLEAGWGWGRWAWDWIVAGVAALTQVVTYDRAGVGESDPVSPAPRGAKHMADDLAALLTTAGLPGPYIVEGHSLGGLIARVFTRDHPDQVAGMVLIDAVHEEAWGGGEHALLPPQTPDEHPGVTGWRQWLSQGMYEWATLPEYLDATASVAEGRACGPLGDRPLVVIRAGNYAPPPDFPQDSAAAIEELRRTIHFSFTHLSSESAYVVAERSGHIVQYDEPEVVLAAILRVVAAVRSHGAEGRSAQ